MTDLSTILRDRNACAEACQWAASLDIATAWATCERTDWMFWWLRRCEYDREALNRCNLDFMTFALEAARPRKEGKPWWPAVEKAHDRVMRAITRDHGDLSGASREAAAAYAAYAAYAAAYAAYAAAACAADAAAYAAAYAAAAAGRKDAVRAMCNVIRKHFPTAPSLKVTK